MKRIARPTSMPCWAILFVTFATVVPLHAGEGIEITPDVVYGHKHGMALTFDVFQPEGGNGVGVLFMVSGGWFSRWAPPEQTCVPMSRKTVPIA